jgi:hypothetical protein
MATDMNRLPQAANWLLDELISRLLAAIPNCPSQHAALGDMTQTSRPDNGRHAHLCEPVLAMVCAVRLVRSAGSAPWSFPARGLSIIPPGDISKVLVDVAALDICATLSMTNGP